MVRIFSFILFRLKVSGELKCSFLHAPDCFWPTPVMDSSPAAIEDRPLSAASSRIFLPSL